MYKVKIKDLLRIYWRGYLAGSRGYPPLTEEDIEKLIKEKSL